MRPGKLIGGTPITPIRVHSVLIYILPAEWVSQQRVRQAEYAEERRFWSLQVGLHQNGT